MLLSLITIVHRLPSPPPPPNHFHYSGERFPQAHVAGPQPDCHSEVYGEPGKRENGGQIDKERALRHASHRQGFAVRCFFEGNSRRRSLSHHASHHMLPTIIFSLGAVLITVSRTQASSKCN